MKNIYITWHYTNYGVAYLKHALSAFYIQKSIPVKIELDKLDQLTLNETFNQPISDGFVFDKIIYLTTSQGAFDKLSSRRLAYKRTILEDPIIQANGLTDVYEDILNKDELCYRLEEEIDYISGKYPEKIKLFNEAVWRNIQHYPIDQQLVWLSKYSNFTNVYKTEFELVDLNVENLRDEIQISSAVYKWVRDFKRNNQNANIFINVSLGSSETQVVWHTLSESGKLPSNTRFVKTYDDKSEVNDNRFKKFSIIEIPTNIGTSIRSNLRLYEGTKSESRKLVQLKMNVFIETGFSILLLGERGVGKSQIVNEKKTNTPPVQVNCASFEDDNMAEAALFGYEKGAFTGANMNKKGLFKEADNGILFLDEIHHLSKGVQAKLMKALQTDENNKMSIRSLGSNKEIKVECRLIFATNKTINELRECLLPDFYDRIVQHVIYIPPLRETVEDREIDWQKVWSDLKFKKYIDCPKENELMNWLNELPLYGNFRDLQKIAMYYNAYNRFDEETKKLISENSAFEYAKSEFEKYHSPYFDLNTNKINFSLDKTSKEMIADYLFELQKWAIDTFNGRINAVNHFKSLGETISEKTLNNWKNRARLKEE